MFPAARGASLNAAMRTLAEVKMIRAVTLWAIAAAGSGLLQAAGANAYIQHNLVSDQPGVADVTDPNLVNAWDLATSAASPFWVSANGTGLATVYSTSATA